MNVQSSDPILRVDQITKAYGSLLANEHVSFEVYKGQVHCLLGENGAGKSTISKCIYGASKPDSGSILFKKQHINFSSPRDAIRLGIGMVHQHFVLSPPMNAVENIIVGDETPGFLLNIKEARQKIQALCEQYGIILDLDLPVAQLSVGKQQWVEILKTLYAGVELLLLDEPTAVLTPQEVESLFAIIRKMTGSGISVILVTHKLHEVMSISDKVTVLRKGKVVATVETRESTRASLARLLVGRDFDFSVHREKIERGRPILDFQDVTVLRDNGARGLNHFSLTVHQGEILGLAGVSGNGQVELFDALVGVRHVQSGQILLDGEGLGGLGTAEIMKKGLASVPQDRLKQGLIGEFSLEENVILGFHHAEPFCSSGLLNWKSITAFANQAISRFDIATQGPQQKVEQLSGGNLQKLILAREVSRPVKALIASSPTRGLDINSTYHVYQRFLELLKTGAGILMISEDLDEIFNVADRIAVIFNGQIMGIFNANEVDREKIGMLMTGIKEDE